MRLPLKKRGAEQYVSILSAAHKRKRIPPVIELTQYPASTPIIAWLARLRAAMTFAAVVCFILRYLTNVADAVRPIELQIIIVKQLEKINYWRKREALPTNRCNVSPPLTETTDIDANQSRTCRLSIGQDASIIISRGKHPAAQHSHSSLTHLFQIYSMWCAACINFAVSSSCFWEGRQLHHLPAVKPAQQRSPWERYRPA